MKNENNNFSNIPVISNRLLAISKLLTYGDMKISSICDIGTDHGYLPIYIAMTDKNINKIIACDINKGPLESAQENLVKYEVFNKIELRLGGGFSAISKDEVEVATCSGMGGKLMLDIIENDIETVKHLKRMICQPQSDLPFFRKRVIDLGFNIIHEEMLFESNQFYNILLIENSEKLGGIENYTEIEYELGKSNLEFKTETFKDYINYKINGFENIINSIGIDKADKAKEKIKSKLDLYLEVLEKWE